MSGVETKLPRALVILNEAFLGNPEALDDWPAALRYVEAELQAREQALLEVHDLLWNGEADNALHGLDAFLARRGLFATPAHPDPED